MYHLKKTKKAWLSGGFDNSGSIINEFIFKKRGKEFSQSEFEIIENHQFNKTIKLNTVNWGGFIVPHYGHFLLESLTRYYAFNQSKYPIVFFSKFTTLPKWAIEIFEMLDIQSKVILIAEDTLVKIKHLKIAKAGYELESPIKLNNFSNSYTHKFFESLRYYSRIDQKFLNKKIWLSRRKLKKRTIINEEQLENHLGANGWLIVCPENLHVKQQISLFTSASRIAGFIGSAFHTLLLAKTVKAQLDIFVLSKEINLNFINLGQDRKLNQRFHDVNLRSISGEEFNTSSWNLSHEQARKIMTILENKTNNQKP